MTKLPLQKNSGSVLSLWSQDSILSIGSVGSVLSVGSVGSALSIASIGSALSAGSIGSSLSLISTGSWLSTGSSSRPTPAGRSCPGAPTERSWQRGRWARRAPPCSSPGRCARRPAADRGTAPVSPPLRDAAVSSASHRPGTVAVRTA
ncbi:hypothetical protein SHKM778_87690 [Streptomyces sp. KM77-8]|uniref:Uncharacterized protein n=1 Tax=Streptomyces haneummycinicus TaxID=3074435 RepID=A0AAT9HYB0_9ACTN